MEKQETIYFISFRRGASLIKKRYEKDLFNRIIEYLENIFQHNGFIFEEYISKAILNCSANNDINTAIRLYNDICEKYKQNESIIEYIYCGNMKEIFQRYVQYEKPVVAKSCETFSEHLESIKEE